MSTAFLSLGSNVDAEHHIRAAVRILGTVFSSCSLSPVYRNHAVGFEGEDFINLVAAIDTHLSPEELRRYLRNLEDRFGRNRNAPRFSDRTLDVDILLFDDRIVDSGELKLPRPEIMKFAHVLKPLADLAPNLRHPLENRTMSELWESSGLGGVELQEIELDFA